MKSKNYIFITNEGCTFQPNSSSSEPDIENAQIIGFAKGSSPDEAFNNLLAECIYLRETNFNELICYELNKDFDAQYFYLHKSF